MTAPFNHKTRKWEVRDGKDVLAECRTERKARQERDRLEDERNEAARG